MTSDLSEKIFAALGDNTRFQIVEYLKDKGEVRAGDIVDFIGGSAPSISRHLRILRISGVLRVRAVSQTRLYSVDGDVIQKIQTWSASFENMNVSKYEEVE